MTPERAAAIEAWVNGDKPWANNPDSPYFMPWYWVREDALVGFIADECLNANHNQAEVCRPNRPKCQDSAAETLFQAK